MDYPTEQKIADFLQKKKIEFTREQPFILKQNGSERWRIVYPDFYLMDYGIIIEFFGVQGKQSYDEKTKYKKDGYYTTGLKYISVYPNTENWQEYVIQRIKTINKCRFESSNKL